MKKQSILALSIPVGFYPCQRTTLTEEAWEVKTIRSQLNLVVNSPTILNTTRSTVETNPSMKAQPLRDHNSLAGAAPARVPSTSPNMLGKNMKTNTIAGTLSPKVSRVPRLGSPTKPARPASTSIQSPSAYPPRKRKFTDLILSASYRQCRQSNIFDGNSKSYLYQA